jgi:antitoxin (DNA-binding transcriptional repressor) of toxin-antitoxin stability system
LKTVNVHEAKSTLSQLLHDIERGEEAAIARNGVPVARLTALAFFGAGDTTMSDAGLEAFQGDVAVSPITVWELTRKTAQGKLPPLPTEGGSFVRHCIW